MSITNKDQIRDRMIKSAARLWGAQENEIEATFDPLILLMIEACAAELEKVGYEISNAHSRLLDRLADLILPEVLTGPKPASCILQAMPADPVSNIDPSTDFTINYTLNTTEKGGNPTVDFHFAPIGNFRLVKATLRYLFSGNKLFKVQENNYRELVYSHTPDLSSNEIWLAVALDKEAEVVKGLPLFFNLQSHSESTLFYNALQQADAFLNGHRIQLKKGYFQGEQFELNPETMLSSGNNYTQKVNREVAYKYANRFLHIDDNIIADASPLPEALRAKLPADIATKLAEEDLVYIQLQLNKYFPQEVFDGLHCSINAFPVVNLRSHTQTVPTDDWANIIPLSPEGLFFDLKEVRAADNSTYKFRSAAGAQDLEAGEVILSTSGIGKTNAREVREMISILSEAIRDQSAYFENVSNEFIHSRLKEINQLITGLEDQLAAAKDSSDIHHYLLLRPKKENDLVTIEYWTTEGVYAHQLKAGFTLSTQQSSIQFKRSVMLTQPIGGRNGVSTVQKKELLRQQLTSRGKIITADDVKLLCKQLFGDRLYKVEVHKGIQVSADRKQGFTRSIDVKLTYSAWVDSSMKTELEGLCRELEYCLYTNGSPVYPYRVLVETDNS